MVEPVKKIKGTPKSKNASVSLEHEKETLSFQRIIDQLVGVNAEYKVMLYRQLASMVSAGFPVTRAIATLINQQHNAFIRQSLNYILHSLLGGRSISVSISNHPKLFDRIYVSLIKAGEVSGNLPLVLNDMAIYAENQMRLKKKIVSNLTYPMMSVLVAFIVLTLIFLYAFPGFIEIFDQMDFELPLITKIVISTYQFIVNPFTIFVALLLIIMLFFVWKNVVRVNPLIRIRLDKWKLQLPLIGKLYQKLSLTFFCRALVLLYKSGIPFLQILPVLRGVTGNEFFNTCIDNMISDFKDGTSLSQCFANLTFVPPILIRTIAVAEKIGQLELMVEKITEYFETDIEYTLDRVIVMIEPIVMALISCFVLVVLLSVFLPLLQLTSMMGQ